MSFFRKIIILFTAWKNRSVIKKSHSKMIELSIAKWVLLTGVQPKTGLFPLGIHYEEKLKSVFSGIENIKITQGKVMDTFLVGDSLSDFTRKFLTTVDDRLNFAKAGEASSYYIQILKDTQRALKGFNIKYLIIECWGNELLAHYSLEDVKAHVTNTLNLARAMYPNVKLIIGSLPPVYDVYVNTVKIEFTQHLIEFVNNDPNSTLVLFEKHFSGLFGIFPKIDYSSDGVHFSGKGILEYDALLNRAKETKLKVLY